MKSGLRCARWGDLAWLKWWIAAAGMPPALPRDWPPPGMRSSTRCQLNQVLVSFGDPQKTQQVIRAIQQDGTCWCGGTVWQGQTAMRISVSSWATTEADVERSLEAMLRIAATL